MFPAVALSVRQRCSFYGARVSPRRGEIFIVAKRSKISFSSFRSEIIREDVAPKGATDFICDRYYKYVAPKRSENG